MATHTTTTQNPAELSPRDDNRDVVTSLIDARTTDLAAAVETRRVYDFRLPRGHIGRRRRPRMLSVS